MDQRGITKNSFILWIVVLIGFFGLLLLSRFIFKVSPDNGQVPPSLTITPHVERINCSDMQCLGTNFLDCTPSEYTYANTYGKISLIVYGHENGKCHFQIIGAGSLKSANCFLSNANVTVQVLNQLFGTESGVGYIVQQECTT